MKKALIAIVMLAGLSISNVCLAQEDDAKEQFIAIDPLTIEGGVITPTIFDGTPRLESTFESKLKLEKSFLPKISESSQSDALDS